MNKLFNYLKCYLVFFISLIIYLLLISISYYFELFNYKTICVINYIVIIILFFILGFDISKKEMKKGYYNGFLISAILVIIFALISIIVAKINISSLVYYLSLIISSMTGGIIGVIKK